MSLKLKITLKGIKPEIWRTVAISEKATFEDLHHLIQAAMGWDSYHLWDFKVGKNLLIEPEIEDVLGIGEMFPSRFERLNASETRLKDYLKPKMAILYTYDMGDDWEHTVKLMSPLKTEPDQLPICLDGARACPPEDCGGVWGYKNILSVLTKKKKSADDKELLEWLGGDFDPEHFDIDEVNDVIQDEPDDEEEGF